MSDEELQVQDTEGLQGYQTTTEEVGGVEGTTVSAADLPMADAPLTAPVTDEQAGTWQSIRDAAQQRGFQFAPTVTDDRAALDYLIQQAALARQSDVYAQLGRQLAPKAEQIQQYLRQQQAPAQPARQPWEAREWDDPRGRRTRFSKPRCS
jgi:hypothetical protein